MHMMNVSYKRIVMRKDILKTRVNIMIRQFESYISSMSPDQENYWDIRKKIHFDLTPVTISPFTAR